MTEQLYYSDSYLKEFDAMVLSSTLRSDGRYEIILDKTAFYPEGGGQPGDTGIIANVTVFDTQITDNSIIHICSGYLEPGIKVHCLLNWERRFDYMQQHSGEHIISGIICSELDCDNIGFHLGSETVTIDYNKYADINKIREIEEIANRYIAEDHRVVISYPDENELSSLNYRSKKEIDNHIRIVSFPGADTCACCGTHLNSSAQVILVKIISHKKFHDGMRLELLCGNRAVKHLLNCWEQNAAVSRELSAPVDHTHDAVHKLLEQNEILKSKYSAAEEELFRIISEQFINKGNTYIIREDMESVSLRKLCDSIFHKCGGFCIVFSGHGNNFKYALMSSADSFSSLIHDINSELHGRGGGRDGLAQGTVIADVDEINAYMSSIIK